MMLANNANSTMRSPVRSRALRNTYRRRYQMYRSGRTPTRTSSSLATESSRPRSVASHCATRFNACLAIDVGARAGTVTQRREVGVVRRLEMPARRVAWIWLLRTRAPTESRADGVVLGRPPNCEALHMPDRPRCRSHAERCPVPRPRTLWPAHLAQCIAYCRCAVGYAPAIGASVYA